MTEPTDTAVQAPHYEGRQFPIDVLSPSEFEKFVFSSLLCIEDVLGLRITGKPTGSGDGGFDVQGDVVASRRLACVQCKRQKEPLGTPQVAEELAKVAPTAALEGSDVGEHRFICTGGVRRKLRNQLREQPLQHLANEAGERLANSVNGELTTLRLRLETVGADPRKVAEDYVLGLDLLTAWGAEEFDAALSPHWNDVLQVAERHFKIATVVREHPRASFGRAAYIAEHCNFKAVVEPRLSNPGLPEGITVSSEDAPSFAAAQSTRIIKRLDELTVLAAGELAILLGDGGVGKSTTLKLLRAESLRIAPDSTLPIHISLTNYVAGGLDQAIHQELGVEHGTWRSLPDKVLLLCDGLNECPSANVSAFLKELKHLLKRNRVACVLSTRELTRHRKIVLPQPPVVCVKVEGITPIAIRRIAEYELQDGTTESFITAYRSLTDSSWSPLLWTPFAVEVALRLWKQSKTLPATLGEMLEALLKARCEKNAELPEQGPAPEVVLYLAGALAFQCLIIDRRLECPALEAGKCIREAKKQCEDALGIADMSETEVVDLLARHELLKISEGGHLSFGHQLMAGALAASILSRVWRDHTDCLGEPVADDAWIFAARMVPQEHVEDFLEEAFHIDLMLGAKATRELSDNLCEFAERLLERAVAEKSPETVRLQGLFALARIGSAGAIDKLRKFATDTGSQIHHAAQHALAATGDQSYLRKLLPEVDHWRSCGVRVSGGEIGIWEAAPLPIRLDLVRERLSKCNDGEPVGESLSLLAYERDPADMFLVEKHFRAATHLIAWQPALYALHEISPTRAKEVLIETLSEISKPTDRAAFMHSAAHIGIAIDVRSAFECAVVELSPDESDGHAEYQLSELISDVIAKSPLPVDLVAVVECELPTSSGERRNRLWQIATGCKISSFAEYASLCVGDWGVDLANACNYFIAQPELARVRRQQLVEFCENGFEDEQTWYAWKTWRALTLVGELGFSAKTANLLSAMIKRLVRVQRATETGDNATLSPADAAVLKDKDLENARFYLGRLASHLIPAAAKARVLLPDDVLISLLNFNSHSYSGVVEHLREALSGLSDSAIDETLNKVIDPRTRLSGLEAVCALGLTRIRVDMLARELRQNYVFPAALNIVLKAIEACWCKDVCEMVARTVAEIPSWSEYESQFFWDFVRAVSRRVEPEDQAIFEAAILKAQTVFARRILNIWRDQASGDRVGLARLSW
jgi:hypothetical protein